MNIKVWLLDLNSLLLEPEEGVLSHLELTRSQRLFTAVLQERFRRAHYAKRRILSEVTGIPPAALQFSQEEQGKPSLDMPEGTRLDFNLSHSGSKMLLAVMREGKIGVDLEQIKTNPDVLALSALACTPSEDEWLKTLTGAGQVKAFYDLWTVKEAVLKAHGIGIQGGLKKVRLPLPLPEVGFADYTGEVPTRYKFWLFSIGVGYAAAMAAPLAYSAEWDRNLISWPPKQDPLS